MKDDDTTSRSIKERFARHGSDTFLEGAIIVGFIAVLFVLLFKEVPDKNKEQFAQFGGAMIVLVTLIGKSLWERRGSEGAAAETSAVRAEITRDAVAKLPPVGTADQIAPPVAETLPATGGAEELPEYAR